MIEGSRKLALGLVYLIGGIACVGGALYMEAGAGVISSVAAAFVSFATGLGVIVWGNVATHRAKNGGPK